MGWSGDVNILQKIWYCKVRDWGVDICTTLCREEHTLDPIEAVIGATDIYLVDQIMKGRYRQEDIVLDAGCGYGRNLHWFLRNEMVIYGIDMDGHAVQELRSRYPMVAERFLQGPMEKLPFGDVRFDHVISSAVLHFATSFTHFHGMIAEMVRVLKPGGSLFIRMTADIGIENKVRRVGDGIYEIPDGSRRFLLSRTLLAEMMRKNGLSFLEPPKTVNVNDVRCMSTLVLRRD
jgi:tellurite methyltransferase